MKLNKDYILRSICDEHILVYTGTEKADSDGFYVLNEVGYIILRHIDEAEDINRIAEYITEEFDIDKKTAAEDAAEYISELKDKGILI